MQLVTLRLGSPDTLFAPATSARLPFAFAAPVDGAYALLQSFYLSVDDSGSDMELETMRVSLQTLFDPLQSKTDGQIEIDIQYDGSRGLLLESSLIRAQIDILIVGV